LNIGPALPDPGSLDLGQDLLLVAARSSDALTSERLLEWRVRGWRKSGKLIGQVASDLSAGHEPPDAGPPV
jgi:hypothetical protein